MTTFTESTVESATLTWLSDLGWQDNHGSEVALDGFSAEQQNYGQVVLEERLRDALLPKLIREVIRVKDAERFLNERGL